MHLDERAFDDGVGHGNPGEGRKQRTPTSSTSSTLHTNNFET